MSAANIKKGLNQDQGQEQLDLDIPSAKTYLTYIYVSLIMKSERVLD